MSKNCAAKTGTEQKLMSQVLNCIWNQYVKGRTPKTVAYLAAPSLVGFGLMTQELQSIDYLVNTTTALAQLNELVCQNGENVIATLDCAYANGALAYTTSNINISHTFNDSSLNELAQEYIVNNKITMNLNMSDCVNTYEQISPEYIITSLNGQSPIYNWVTAATIGERSGCAGVSNTGFILLKITGDINAFPFKTCVNKCAKC